MKKIIFLVGLLATTAITHAGTQLEIPFAGSKVVLLDSAAAAAANIQSDAYTKVLTPFDLQIRLGITQGATEKDYLNLAASQVRSWDAVEQQQLQQAFATIDSFLKAQKIQLDLPPVIQMIKTGCKEEFGAEGYTRGNRIMLHTDAGQPLTVHLVAHELFHVYSRFNEAKRDAVYSIFGFKKCNRIKVAAATNGRVITNPDCPFIEHYITVTQKNPIDVTLLLYSDKDYKEGLGLGDYIRIGLLALEGKGMNKRPEMKGGLGVVYELQAVPDLFRQISNNTPYALHPEEIAAEHFAMWIGADEVPEPRFLERLADVLQK